MSSIVTQMIVAERYGVRLSIEQLSSVLGISKGTIYNQLGAETFAIPTYLDNGKRFADFRDVAAHFDACRDRARVKA